MGMINVLSRFREGTVFKPTGNRIANLQIAIAKIAMVSESGEMCFLNLAMLHTKMSSRIPDLIVFVCKANNKIVLLKN